MQVSRFVALSLGIAIVAPAAAQGSDIGVSLGVRLFVNRVSGPGYEPTGLPGVPLSEASIVSEGETSLLPSLAVRIGRWVLNGSYHIQTTYSAPVPEGGGVFDFKRKEWDLALGYAVLPNLVLSAGWKSIDIGIDQPGNDALPQSVAGPFVGVAISAPLSGAWSVYGSLAAGQPKFEIGGTKAGKTGDYLASELGFRYALGEWSPSLRSASLLAGYRSQSFRFKDVRYSFLGIGPDGVPGLQVGRHHVRQGIDGLTIGVTISY